MAQCLALDIGGTKIAAALVDERGAISARQQIATPRGNKTLLASALESLVLPLRAEADFIAVASTGIIQNGKLSALNPANLGGLADFPLAECLEACSALPVVLLNDGQAAAWAEYLSLNGQIDNLLFVTVSTGVGGGIVLNGSLQIGKTGLAGHIGHTLADPNGPHCGCGRRGCVESIASGTAIAAATAGWATPLNAQQVFSLAAQGEDAARTIFNRSANAIAQMIADMTMALDIEHVVLGGSVGLASGYAEQVRIAQHSLPALYRPPLTLAHHRQDSGLLGAARWASTVLKCR
ncbi:N-acetylmannosamine kinase [Edaphovirga cremea]|uniref:N-acetylmannosamine kinase n=1 Tax=Edaphovirga cremea TaxID=2267246 RepID=UPI000DEECDFD|nr:N-acetylmannosamine kinase [Edaphovirga cremea]